MENKINVVCFIAVFMLSLVGGVTVLDYFHPRNNISVGDCFQSPGGTYYHQVLKVGNRGLILQSMKFSKIRSIETRIFFFTKCYNFQVESQVYFLIDYIFSNIHSCENA